jgi:hypothetical protein
VIPLPKTAQDFTRDWLQSAVPALGIVGSVEVDEVLPGSTTKVFLRIETDHGLESLCTKGVFDEPRLPVRVLASQQEARFFGVLAPTLKMPLFRTWFAEEDEVHGVVIFDDLRGAGTTFTEVGSAWGIDRVAAALEVQAAWHAATWGTPTDKFGWLVPGNQVLASATEQLFSEEFWTTHLSDPETVNIPAPFDDRKRMKAAVNRLFSLQAQRPVALSHGDAHIGNTYVDAQGQPGFYDWQTFCLNTVLDDVTYFIGSALEIGDRRQGERDLLTHYLDALAGHGGPRLDAEEAWLDYRRYQIHGFFWAVLPKQWQPPRCSIPLAERFMAGIEDHDTLTLLAQT